MPEQSVILSLPEDTVDLLATLVHKGRFPTPSAAVQAAILRLAQEYRLIKPGSRHWEQLLMVLRGTGRPVTHRDIVQVLEELEQEA
jgi:Arc/MetJ-type ribon-helix-helix transcriptional regulator